MVRPPMVGPPMVRPPVMRPPGPGPMVLPGPGYPQPMAPEDQQYVNGFNEVINS